MLCKKREVRINGEAVLRTPILLPSFSSKGFEKDRINRIFKFCEGLITDEMLVSLYDLHHKFIPRKITNPRAIFVDSGGYEVSEEFDLSDVQKTTVRRAVKPWRRELYQRELKKLDFGRPHTIVVSYDHPKSKTTILGQIKRAKEDFELLGTSVGREILFKTEKPKSLKKGARLQPRFLNIDEIIKRKRDLHQFDVIGVTEKELGASTFERMKNIARLRIALTEINLETPIHVFGSLDTISTPLYFLAGADIFDGLTWLRYAYSEGYTIYKHNYAVKELGAEVEDYAVDAQVVNKNYYYMARMKEEMRRFLNSHEFSEFEHHGELFAKAVKLLNEHFGQNNGG